MKCPACAQALTGGTPEYRINCTGCTARAAAKSGLMSELMKHRESLGDLLRRTMPGVPPDQAWREVLAWWRIEEQGRQTAGEVSK